MNTFYINIFRDRMGKPFHMECDLITDITTAAEQAEREDNYEFTVTHEGIKHLQDMFSEEWHEAKARDEHTDRSIDALKDMRTGG